MIDGAQRILFPLLRSLIIGALLATTVVQAQSRWTPRHEAGGGAALWGIALGESGLVVVGTGGKILSSIDARTWTARVSGSQEWLTSVAYGNGRYVAVGDRGVILTSTDAQAWTRVTTTSTTARLNKVAFGGGRWIAVGQNGTMITSTGDARTWSRLPDVGFVGWLRGLAFHSGCWVVVGEDGAFGFSNGGETWTRRVSGFTQDFESAAYVSTHGYTKTSPTGETFANSYHRFLALAADGTTMSIAYTLYDGQTVVSTSDDSRIRTAAAMRGLTSANGMRVATGGNGTVAASLRPTGSWTVAAAGTRSLHDVIYALDSFLAVGDGETIMQSEPVFPGRLANVSTRGVVGLGDETMIAGTIISGVGRKQMLIRAIGPSLADFGVSAPLADPVLTVFDRSGRALATNTGWTRNESTIPFLDAFVRAGAFPLDPSRADSALLLTLEPGPYTFQVRSASGRTGIALVEAYEVDGPESWQPRTVNLSTRLQAGVNENMLIAGLVVGGSAARKVLVRGIGPTLAQFQVKSPLADPLLRVVRADGSVVAQNDNWATVTVVDNRPVLPEEIRDVTATVGAFPLNAASKDSALLITLAPGNYTLQVSGVGGTTGVALVEAYEIP